eukprot:1132258-Rhodomonas_salina.1
MFRNKPPTRVLHNTDNRGRGICRNITVGAGYPGYPGTGHPGLNPSRPLYPVRTGFRGGTYGCLNLYPVCLLRVTSSVDFLYPSCLDCVWAKVKLPTASRKARSCYRLPELSTDPL